MLYLQLFNKFLLQDHAIYSNFLEILFLCSMFVFQYSGLMLLSQKHKTEQTQENTCLFSSLGLTPYIRSLSATHLFVVQCLIKIKIINVYFSISISTRGCASTNNRSNVSLGIPLILISCTWILPRRTEIHSGELKVLVETHFGRVQCNV